jgi:hypothetical protein
LKDHALQEIQDVREMGEPDRSMDELRARMDTEYGIFANDVFNAVQNAIDGDGQMVLKSGDAMDMA